MTDTYHRTIICNADWYMYHNDTHGWRLMNRHTERIRDLPADVAETLLAIENDQDVQAALPFVWTCLTEQEVPAKT